MSSSAENSANNSISEDSSKVQEPLTPSIHLTPNRSASVSTPSNNFLNNDQQSKFKLFDDTTTPLQRSTNSLNQSVATAPPLFRRNDDDSQLESVIPTDLVDINLALGALDLDYGGARPTGIIPGKDTGKDESGETTDGVKGLSTGETPVPIEGQPGMDPLMDHFNQMLLHQQRLPPFLYNPVNEFGQPLHAGFNPNEPMGSPHPQQPWPTKPFSPNMNGAIQGGPPGLMESLSHTPPPLHPGMIPLRPFNFSPDGIHPQIPPPPGVGGIPGGPNGPGQVNFPGVGNFGMINGGPQNKDRRSNLNFQDRSENGGFNNQQPHPLQNQQLWPPLNNRNQFDNNGFNSHHHHQGGNNGPNGRRYNNYNGNYHGHGRRNMGQRRRGEDASKFANARLADFQGEIYSLCKDQHGCRFLQKQLDLNTGSSTIIFDEIHQHVIELMIDPFGNYLIQKLLEKVNDEQRITLVENASSQFVSIALDPHGTRALQKLVECINTQKEAEIIVESLSSDVVSLSRDLNGNHVIQKCLQRLTPADSQFIFDAASENCSKIATHRHGCCVLQRCLDHGSKEQCEQLSLVISKSAVDLSLDAFGNYVVQYVLAKDEKEAIAKIIDSVKTEIVKLSLHKFGSNVIEKCLRVSTLSKQLIDEILKSGDELVKLLNDPFGNYVLQTSLDVAKEEQFEQLSSLLKPLLPQVRNTPHGKRISARLQQPTEGETPSSSTVPSAGIASDKASTPPTTAPTTAPHKE
ncbi:hypothetical protein BN7_1327 [Wickerhamomyces ciferrii]|uniref:PUM-HD domain-containing protein n=1 Tax=Wickerhamomyces ciferrii (strain ATCC 14091 / BCRC 22168 / CBS 111 / JCM 3599 / NBRC 0793 / NRRL Y-1031 F-60-10) TaxID=1206466 RepID=K0KL22_WICCF|nr:uncharacterized protein BN7_1327 [Wickerhamomyces ciferrii]CCH41788.1 hypothetical protein BN7_1327 [Wickerhamomyces ciferrii]